MLVAIVFGFFGLLLITGIVGVGVSLYRSKLATESRGRLRTGSAQIREQVDAGSLTEVGRTRRSGVLRRYWWVGVFVAAGVVASLWFFLGIPWPYLIAAFVMVFLCVAQIDEVLLQKRTQKLEQQMADSIDMMVAAVKSGAGLQSAFESSVLEAGRPWQTETEQLVRAIRYGQDPVDAMLDLADRLPLESVLLFTQTLAVNWRVGGRLAITLANVGRTVRDRIELTRRMVAMTTQARLSVVSVIAVTYFIGALIWRNDPERMTGFLSSMIGQGLVSVGMVLQAVGIVWISWLSKPRF